MMILREVKMRVKVSENGVDIEIYLTAKETQKYFASPKYQEIQGKVEKDVIKSESKNIS